MATMTTAAPLEARYTACNIIAGKWAAIIRRSLWMFCFIFAFMVVLVNYVQVRTVPTFSAKFGFNLLRRPDDWWMILLVCASTALFVGLFLMATLAVAVKAFSVRVFADRIEMRAGMTTVVKFGDIVGVEEIRVPAWPRLSSYCRDMWVQAKFAFGTPHYKRMGFSQIFKQEATFVLIHAAGHRWWRGYLLDVDDPATLLNVLNNSIGDYVGANPPEANRHNGSH